MSQNKKLILTSFEIAIKDSKQGLAQTEAPFKVDIIDWHRISEEFQSETKKGYCEF